MPKGVYDRSVRLTAEQKKERQAAHGRRHRERNRERLLEQQRRYHRANRERRLQQKTQYRTDNREAIASKQKQYRNKNRKELAKYEKQYRQEHRDVRAVLEKQYYRDHPEVTRRKKAKRRASKLNATVGDVAALTAWEKTWRAKKVVVCHWCRKRIKTADAHVDHVVPLSKGGAHDVGNVCVACNLSKSAKLPEVWNASLSQPLLFV